jgi:hypothetical protein
LSKDRAERRQKPGSSSAGEIVFGAVVQFATTAISLVVFCGLGVVGEVEGAYMYRGIVAFDVRGDWGLCIGGFIAGCPAMMTHEFGHALQARLLRWLYLPVIGFPSLVCRVLQDEKASTRWFEVWADDLSEAHGWNPTGVVGLSGGTM